VAAGPAPPQPATWSIRRPPSDYQLCHACRVGCVNKISITPEYQRKGLGRWAVRHALARGRGYAWVTTGKSPEGKAYFAEMARQSGAAFAQRVGSCAHTEVR
jgi:GNAT superfamily N-acetyltransferase